MTGILLAILHGIGAGLLLAIFVGPVFFVLLQTSIRKGFRDGVLFSGGIILSDMTYFIMAFFGVSAFGPHINLKLILPIIGGLFLLGYGFIMIFKDYHIHDVNVIPEKTTHYKVFIKGFLVNAISPSGFIYWLGVVSTIQVAYEGETQRLFAFFFGCMATVFGTDLLKSYYANKLRTIITDKVLFYVNRFGGALLIIVGSVYVTRYIILPYVHF